MTTHWDIVTLYDSTGDDYRDCDNSVCVFVSDEDSNLPLLFLRYLLETFCMNDVTDQSEFVILMLLISLLIF